MKMSLAGLTLVYSLFFVNIGAMQCKGYSNGATLAFSLEHGKYVPIDRSRSELTLVCDKKNKVVCYYTDGLTRITESPWNISMDIYDKEIVLITTISLLNNNEKEAKRQLQKAGASKKIISHMIPLLKPMFKTAAEEELY